jgi:hypothetical protein
VTHIAVSTAGADVRLKPSDVTDYVVAEKTSVIHIYKRLCNVCGSVAVDRNTIGHWVNRVTASETGKAKLRDQQLQLQLQPRSGRSLSC